jgi:hypothetical protein
MAWFPGAYDLRALSWDTCARLGSRWARLPHAGLAAECALCAFLQCKSCFIRDIDLCGPMAAFLALHTLRALSWGTVMRRGSRWRLPTGSAEVDFRTLIV